MQVENVVWTEPTSKKFLRTLLQFEGGDVNVEFTKADDSKDL